MPQQTEHDKKSSPPASQALSGLQHYVRITGIRNQRFVEFDFAIDDPMTFIELVLPFDQYKKFCKKHNAIELTPEQAAEVDFDKMKWRYGEPGINH
jgi:phenol hydroxylase P0 protein